MDAGDGVPGDQGDAADESAGTPVALVENDLFFVVKVRDTLKHAGYEVHVSRGADDFARGLATGGQRPRIALVNTAARGIDYERIIALAREAGVPIVAYGAHVDLATQQRAREAGATRVITNARLATDLVGIVARILGGDSA